MQYPYADSFVGVSIASSHTIGRRTTDEDAHRVSDIIDMGCVIGQSHLFTTNTHVGGISRPSMVIADGHNGSEMANLTAKTLSAGLGDVIVDVSEEAKRVDTVAKIKHLYQQIDKRQERSIDSSGCACSTITLVDGWVVGSSVGDSRAIVIKIQDQEKDNKTTRGYTKAERGLDDMIRRFFKPDEGADSESMEEMDSTPPLTDDDEPVSEVDMMWNNMVKKGFIEENKVKVAVIAMSSDHKPSKWKEQRRIQSGKGVIHPSVRTSPDGNSVMFSGPPRSWPGGLSLSRSLGDSLAGKVCSGPYEDTTSCGCGPISNVPSVFFWSGGFDWIVLACDGLWDVLDSCVVAKFVVGADHYAKEHGIEEALFIAEALVKVAYEAGSTDNITVIVAKIKKDIDGIKWGNTEELFVLGKSREIPYADVEIVGEIPIKM